MMPDQRDDLHVLSYRTPAREWVEALPIGNGRLGAMCFGGLLSTRIQLNDDTAWSGSPRSELLPPRASAAVAERAISSARSAIAEGRHSDADAALRGIQHRHSQAFIALADLMIDIELEAGAVEEGDAEPAQYARMLDLRTAVHTVRGRIGEVGIEQRTWISAVDGVLVHEIDASEPVAIRIALSTPLRAIDLVDRGQERSLTIQLPSDVSPPHDGDPDPVRYDDDPSAALRAAVACRLMHDGEERDGMLAGVRSIRLILATQTTYAGLGRTPVGDAGSSLRAAHERIASASARPARLLLDDHVRAHRELYDRAELVLAPGTAQTTVERLASVQRAEGADASADPALAALLFHYGRYLLISSSRPGTLPATLQGIWNQDVQPVWSSNYTVNINLQMNYWGADTTGLTELQEPVLDLMEAVAIAGAETAARLYGAPGWVLHHNTDAWAYTQQIGHGRHDPSHVFWPLGGAWLLVQLCDALPFGAAERWRRRLLPLLEGCARFLLFWLREQADGMLGTSPSTSPENTFAVPDGSSGLSESTTMDLVLIAQLLDRYAEVAASLGVDDDTVRTAAAARRRIVPPRVDADGAIVEWGSGEASVDPHHRHLSPLVFLHPGSGEPEPALTSAAERFLDLRGDESTGWSLVWKVALRARLRDSEAVARLLDLLVRDMAVARGEFSGGLYPNLFAAHPPFQIDANLGIVGALAEALLQSHRGEIELLPAWPVRLGAGRVRGLVARPGVAVSMEWDARTVSATLTALHEAACGRHRVRIGSVVVEVDLSEVGCEVDVESRR